MEKYINLFGAQDQPIIYERPKTALDRKAEQEKKLRDKIEANRLRMSFNPANFNLSSYPRPDVQCVFIGQNMYVRPSYVVSMPEWCYFNSSTGEIVKNPRLMTDSFIENQKNLKDNKTRGRLSKKSISALRSSVNWLCMAAKDKRVFVREKQSSFKFKINFVTLTLPDTEKIISSRELQKNLLNPFITYLREFHGLKNYVWRLEFQANGKLHVHLSADTFLHHKVIRDSWNRLLDKNGYLENFFKKEGHKNPNSTDVHATRKIKNMAAYIAKYMSKKASTYKLSKNKNPKPLNVHSKKRWYVQRVNFWNGTFNPHPITGRVWGCSRELSRANKLTVHVPANECSVELRSFMNNTIQFKEIYSKPAEKPETDSLGVPVVTQARKIGEIFFLTASDWFGKITGSVKWAFAEMIQSISSDAQCLSFEL